MIYPKDMSNSELLSVTLREKSGEELLTHFGSLRNLEAATEEDLLKVGMTRAAARRLLAILELARRYRSEPVKTEVIRKPPDVVRLLGPQLQELQHEEFRAIFLNTKNNVLYCTRTLYSNDDETILFFKTVLV